LSRFATPPVPSLPALTRPAQQWDCAPLATYGALAQLAALHVAAQVIGLLLQQALPVALPWLSCALLAVLPCVGSLLLAARRGGRWA